MSEVVFESHLGTIKSATDEALARAAEIIGGMAESKAKEEITKAVYETPETWYVRTGNLRNRITHEVEDQTTVVIGTDVSYAPYVELGTGRYAKGESKAKTIPWHYKDSEGNWHTTSGMPPRPFLRPAIEKYKDVYKQVLSEEIKKSVT